MKPASAKYVWYDREGQGHNLFALFRKTFELSGDVTSADLHLFTDTYYQLFINGEFVEYGPARFDPRYPLYDSHDITKRLKPGRNVIALLVNFVGHKTFVSIPARAGLVAWGSVKTSAGDHILLETKADTWKVIESKAHGAHPAAKLSFALKAADIFDQALEQEGWQTAPFDDNGWPGAVELAAQDSWGELAPRGIPYMSGEPVAITAVNHTLPLQHLEDRYSFDVPMPFNAIHMKNEQWSTYLAFTTYVYAPEDMTIVAGVHYQETWVNGEPVQNGVESQDKSMRFNQRWNLKKGWNRYFGQAKGYADVMNVTLALPAGKGLIVSADRDGRSAVLLRRTPVMSAEQYERYIKDKTAPFAEDEKLEQIGGWVEVTAQDRGHCAIKETGWDDYADPIETLPPEALPGHTFRLQDYPHGFAVTMDVDHMHLVLPRIRLSGVEGAIVDVTYTEHFTPDNRHFRHVHWHGLGDRIICSRGMVDWIPTNPRGFRYFKLTVRNPQHDVTIESISLRSGNYPVEYRGSFHSSDPLLNEIWQLARRTQNANMEDAFVDCEGRERGMYGRDTIIQYHVNLATFGDQALMRRCLELFGQSPDDTGKFRACYPNTGDYTIADFALNMLEGYCAYYEQTGDRSLIETYWPAMMGNLAWFHDLADERDDLLLDAEWHVHRGIDAHYGGFHGDLGVKRELMAITGIHCVFSIVYLISMQSAIALGKALGKEEDVRNLERRAAILRESIGKFWDAEKGCFADNLTFDTHSVHASLYAVRAGVATPEQLESIRRYVGHELRSLFLNGYGPEDGAWTAPDHAFYLFDGLYKAGMPAIAENVMKQGWGWMLSQGLRTCSEYFDLTISHCHAWGASPAYYLSRNVLGVHFPDAPNLDEVEIRVQTSAVTWAEGAYPHPRGVVEVKWHTENGRRVFDYVKAPEGVKVTIVG